MLKISEFFLSVSAQKAATKIVRWFKSEFKIITLGFPENLTNHNPHHPITPLRFEILVFSTEGKTDDEVFDALMCRNPDDVTMFVTAYGHDATHEICEVSFNGDFANLAGGKHKMVLSHAKGVEYETINKDITLVPFEDKSKGWKQRIATGETMWPVKGLPTRLQASACGVRHDGTIEFISHWRKELTCLLNSESEKELREIKKEIAQIQQEREELKRRRQAAEEKLEQARKYWGYDDPEAVHAAEGNLYEIVEEEGYIYEYGGNIDKTVVIEHFNGEDNIAIEVYAYGIKTKDRYVFTKDGQSLVKIEREA